jgi:RNA polymerase sigma-70 factor, ECF subfamily
MTTAHTGIDSNVNARPKPAAMLHLLPGEPVQCSGPPDFSTVFQRYAEDVARLAFRLMGGDSEVDDVVQDVFVICARKLRQIPTLEHARPWLATVTVRVARRRLRRHRAWQFLHLSSTVELELPARGASPEQHALLRQIYGILDGLPVNQRLAWSLRHLEGQKLFEVARSCQCSLATAKRRIAAAEQTLKMVIDDGS